MEDPSPPTWLDVDSSPQISEPKIEPTPRPAASLADLGQAWQYRPVSGEAFELIPRRGNVLDYETVDARQAGWRITDVEDGALDLNYERGPSISAVPFPNGYGLLFSVLAEDGLRAALVDNEMVLSNAGGEARLQPHPANEFVLPKGRVWVLVESYDDLAQRNPLEFAEARLSFSGYSVGVSAGCNGGGMSFAQWGGRFIPGPHVMTQMACQNDGDAVAGWLVRSGPAFEREGDRLWRNFPEGRIIFEARAAD